MRRGLLLPVVRAPLAAALLAAAACGPSPDFFVHGTGVIVRSDAVFAQREDLPARMESTMETALRYWGGDWRDLEGVVVTLSGAQHVACGGAASALGCYEDGEIRVSTTDPSIGSFHCVEQTVLVHEIGHAVIGDRLHTDPRWMLLDPVAAVLGGRRGYTEDGEIECQIWVSVWRHPLGTP